MSYYPLLNAPGCKGWVGLYNFPPNNWEVKSCGSQFINITWISNGIWKTKNIDVLPDGAYREITTADISQIIPRNALALISLTRRVPPEESVLLPQLEVRQTTVPAWRATLGVASESAKTSYQGELDPFPPQGTLLTFGPFLQYGLNVKNYIILINLEKSAIERKVELEIFDADKCSLKSKFIVSSNAVNVIPLDDLKFNPSDLPVFICRSMAAIPLYFSSAMNGAYLSLEHTHPPGSLVVHGRRWEAQKLLKNYWLTKLS